ncbi:hypothetical protein ACJ73_01386 [Blastomyces percursus]|uniref:AAA+ ATPase domain-containing protein n=1 Tax=Blastomyces percursus TaxID=1658174 RepID=A0A1J9RHW8_9EURO|nr:hypothetical protein ACJ73_01386 [Blastomyces percursus]
MHFFHSKRPDAPYEYTWIDQLSYMSDSHNKDRIWSNVQFATRAQTTLPLLSYFQNSARKVACQPISKIDGLTQSLKSERLFTDHDGSQQDLVRPRNAKPYFLEEDGGRMTKRNRPSNALKNAALDDVCGQELVGSSGTTVARVIAKMVGSRFVEINSTNSGVAECKKLFAEAKNELSLSGRKTILFCDEIHRFSKSQQDIFLGPIESGQITLIGVTTENPSFKVQSALLSRCRTFPLAKLTVENIVSILNRVLEVEGPNYSPPPLINDELINSQWTLSRREGMTKEDLKKSLTKALVYDRAGDQHYDTISAFHKSIRGNDPDAALYYLSRMIPSGEGPLYVARRVIVVASEDIGLADNTMLTLASSAYTAVEIGMPEARVNLAKATVTLTLSKKSTRGYRGLGNTLAVLEEPEKAGLPIPIHLRNAPTELMKEMGLLGKKFLEDHDLGLQVDIDLSDNYESSGG